VGFLGCSTITLGLVDLFICRLSKTEVGLLKEKGKGEGAKGKLALFFLLSPVAAVGREPGVASTRSDAHEK